jgi:hypothetical protein
MISPLRALFASALLVSAAFVFGCDGNDDSSDNGDAPSPTPFIAPPALSTDEALALLFQIEHNVRQPPKLVIATAQVPESEVQERSGLILNGVNETSGLDDVRTALETGDRVGAGEYLYNVVHFDAQPPFNGLDTYNIDEATLDSLDLNSTFDENHSDGMSVSSVYKDSILQMMELWYGLIGNPADDVPSPS